MRNNATKDSKSKKATPVKLSESRKELEKRRVALRETQLNEGWVSHWEDLSSVYCPRRGRFVSRGDAKQQQSNRGKKKHQNIINSSPIAAANTLSSGMMAGMTSPARPWFQLTFADPGLAKFGPVRTWLAQVEQAMREYMLKSNVYKSLFLQYKDLGVFGTGAMSVEENMKKLFHTRPYEIGSYYLATNEEDRVDTIFREDSMTVKQLVEKFGEKKISRAIKKLWDDGSYYTNVNIIHGVFPNIEYNPNIRFGHESKEFSSVYYEKDCENDSILGAGGFEEFPVMASRWVTHGTDVYGGSPGMDALGDNRSMQLKEKRKDRIIDKISDPPMVAPSSATDVSMVPGDITYIDGPVGNQKIEPALIIDARAIPALREDILDSERRINKAFYVDLFMMLANSDRREITAREIEERHEEKLLMLGPVLENIQGDLLDPMIDRIFSIAMRNGAIPPPPREIQGLDMKVEYISILAQAQKSVATAAIKDFIGFVGGLGTIKPDALDKIKFDEAIDKFAEARGVPPEIIRSSDEIKELRGDREKEQQKQIAIENANKSADTAKKLAQSKTQGGESSALDDILGANSGGGRA